MAKKMSMFARLVYFLVGVSGTGALFWFFTNFDKQADMGLLGTIAFILLAVGGVNWLVVSLTGKRNMDLFGLLKL